MNGGYNINLIGGKMKKVIEHKDKYTKATFTNESTGEKTEIYSLDDKGNLFIIYENKESNVYLNRKLVFSTKTLPVILIDNLFKTAEKLLKKKP